MERISLSEWVYFRLKKAIEGGAIKPGTRLMEVHLARKLGVSRTPVREALLRLVSEGCVKWVPFRGFYVKGEKDGGPLGPQGPARRSP